MLTITLELAVLDNGYKFWIKVNASGYVVGRVLSQQQSNNSWWLVAYISQALNETKRNYEIYNQELLAMITELKQWQHYLVDSKFELWSDCKKPQKLNWWQVQWFSEI